MHVSRMLPGSEHWNTPSYEVRVRGTRFLWGSAGLTVDLSFNKPLLFHMRNDEFGEDITFGTQVASGTQTTMGILKAGECVSSPLQDICGVFATCGDETTVACLIRGVA